jgi:nitrile hydratase beta subunit
MFPCRGSRDHGVAPSPTGEEATASSAARLWFDGEVDGIHDLGGLQGFGRVDVESAEPTFHFPWEARTFALAGSALVAGGFNTPMFRHAIERMDPLHYLSSSYYEHWLTALATLLVEEGVVSRRELEERAGGFPLSRPSRLQPGDVDTISSAETPRFSVGDRVRARDIHFDGHTRCPRYVRGRQGVIVRVDGVAPVPEIEAHRRAQVADHTYGVGFELTELWGAEADPNAAIQVDLYERYLEPAEGSR